MRPPCRASSASPPVQTSSLSVWSSSSKLCGPPRHVQGFVSLVLWANNKHAQKTTTTTQKHTHNPSAVRCLSINPMHEFLSSHCTFLLLARGLDNLLLASLPLLSLSSDHLLVSGCRLDIQLVTNTQEQETLFVSCTLIQGTTSHTHTCRQTRFKNQCRRKMQRNSYRYH